MTSASGRCHRRVVHRSMQAGVPEAVRRADREPLRAEPVALDVEVEHGGAGVVVQHVAAVQPIAPASEVARRRHHAPGGPEDGGPPRGERLRIVQRQQPGVGQPERLEEAPLQLRRQLLAAEPLDDEPEKVVVRVRVRPCLPGVPDRRRDGVEDLLRRPRSVRLVLEGRIGDVVEQVAGRHWCGRAADEPLPMRGSPGARAAGHRWCRRGRAGPRRPSAGSSRR